MDEASLTKSSHDFRHPAPGDPYARESVVYMAHATEIDTTIGVYTWVHGDGTAGCSAVLMRAGQPTVGEGMPDEPIAESLDFDDWRLGPLRLQHLEPGRTAHVEWAGKRFGFTLDFTAIHPAYAYGEGPHGCPPYVADDRVEQAGVIALELEVDGESRSYSCTGHRDHSWGIRDWQMMQHYKWVEAQTAESSVHVFEINAYGQRTVYGYVYRDGRLSHVNTADFDVTFDEAMFTTDVDITVVDVDGRRTVLNAHEQSRTEIPVSPAATLVDVSANVTIDGAPGGGWVDFAWPPDYLAHMRDRT